MNFSIKYKVFLFSLIFNLTIVTVISFTIFSKSKEMFLKREIDEKIRILESISKLIDGDKIKSWKTIDDTKTKYYIEIQNLIQKLWEHDEKDTYLYAIKYEEKKDDFFYLIANSYPYEIFWIEFETVSFWISIDKTNNLYIKYYEKDYYDDFEVEFDSKKTPVRFIREKNETKILISDAVLFSTSTSKKLELKINNKIYNTRIREASEEDFLIDKKKYKARIISTGINDTIGVPGENYFPTKKLKEELKYLIRSKNFFFEDEYRKSSYGYFLSIFVPVFDSKKEVSAILVYDLTNHKIVDFENKIYLTLYNYIFYALVLIFVLSLVFSYYLTAPIYSIISILNNSKEKNYNFKIQTKRNDEFQILVDSLNEMSTSIYEKSLSQKNYTIELEDKVRERTVELELAKSKAEKSSKTKTDFLAVTSHELRTPLNGVIGMSSLLKNTELTNEQKDFLNHIESSASNLLTLINNILEVKELENNKIFSENKEFSIKTLLDEILKSQLIHIEEKKLSLSFVFESEIPELLYGNHERYKQVLLNIFSNAIKFTEKGLIQLKVSIEKIEQRQIKLITSITDSGIGVPIEKQENLFRDFSQADSNLNRKYGGTGLGLYISKKILELLGGELSFHSVVNKGSSFVFKFPFEIIDDSKVSIKQVTDLKKLSEEIPLEILVVEDNQVNQILIQKILKNLGYKVDLANDGLIALEKTKQKFYDLIYMDIQMPNMDGITATEIILSESEKKPYIIAITANVLEEDKRRYKEIGFKAHIGKPYPADAIKNSILEMKENLNSI